MPHEDFQPFSWRPTDPTWSDVHYVQQTRVPVYSLVRPATKITNPMKIVRHPNMCDDCNLQTVSRKVCLECGKIQTY